MDRSLKHGIDETALTKGQLRKLSGLRKSVGDKVGEKAFAQWLETQGAGEPEADGNAEIIVKTLWPLVKQGALAIPRGGYKIKRGRRRIIVEPVRS